MKNIDKIRALSAEELADVFCHKRCYYCAYYYGVCCNNICSCSEGVAKWLEQEVEE